MRVAVIDLGTNTFNLLIVDIEQNSTFHKVYNEKIASRLGMGGINSGILTEEAFERGKEALREQKSIITKYTVEKTFAFATSAIRNAKNGEQFCSEVKQELDIDIHIIDGQKEAEFIYWGNKLAVEFTDEPYVIMDIGGGSNEFIIANKNEIFWKNSFELGVTRLQNKFNPSDPITEKQKKDIYNYLSDGLSTLFKKLKEYEVKTLVGSSGSFDTFRDILGGELNYCKTQKSFDLSMNEFNDLYNILTNATVKELKMIKGMDLARIDLIGLACILVDCVVKQSHITAIKQSSYSLKEGVIHSMFSQT